MKEALLLITTIALSGIAVFFSFRARRYAIAETENILKYWAYGVAVLYAGFLMHNIGDALSSYYGYSIELLLESIAHIIIFVSFVLFYKTAVHAIKSTKEYWFK